MELACEKYQQKMQQEGAYCHHPQDYCKFRSACLIQFMSKENRAQADSRGPNATAK